jgi:hypothetical protein
VTPSLPVVVGIAIAGRIAAAAAVVMGNGVYGCVQ